MTEPTQEQGAPRARDEGDVPAREDEHWAGYPGEAEASSYPVVDRGRYKLLLFLTLLAFIGTITAIATRQSSENLPGRNRVWSPEGPR